MENGDVDVKRLSLIDVSFEDDCLIDSPFTQSPFAQPSPSRPHLPETKADEQGFDLMGASDTNVGRKSVSFFDQDPKSSEREGRANSQKFNLRTSLAWDSEFFTSAGVLEPDELTSMIECVEKMENRVLPRILEETQRSTDSISSLASDSLTIASDTLTVASDASAIGSLQVEFFEDIRASIQKSSRAFSKNSSGKAVPDSQTHQSSKKTDRASNDKLKPKPAPKKLSAVMAKSGKSTNQAPVHARSMQLESLPSKPGNPSHVPSFTKRDSGGANRLQVEKRNAEGANSRQAPATKPQARAPSSRYSSSSFASDKMESITSSVDSSVSGSSTSTEKTPTMSSIKKSDETKPRKLPSVRSGLKRPAKDVKSNLPGHLLSTIKLSPACSISGFSSESSSSTSTPKQRSTIARASIGTGSQRFGKEGSGVPRMSNSSKDQQKDGHKTQGSSAQSSVRSASTGTMAMVPNQMKPSGLRMPSPKIGFFDGQAKSGRTPNGSRQTPHVTSGLPKIGAETVGVGGGVNKVKVGKPQSARSSITNGSTRSRSQEPSSSTEKGQISSSPNVEGTQPKVEEVKSAKCNGNVQKADCSSPATKNSIHGTEAGTGNPLLKVETLEDPVIVDSFPEVPESLYSKDVENGGFERVLTNTISSQN